MQLHLLLLQLSWSTAEAFVASLLPRRTAQGPTTTALTSVVESYSKRFPRYRIDLTTVPNRKESLLPFLGDWQQERERSQIAKEYPHVQWIEDDGLPVVAKLWRALASGPATLACTKVQPRVVKQWLDIVEWMQDQAFCDETARLVTVRLLDKGNMTVVIIEGPSTPKSDSLDAKVIEKHTMSWVKRLLVDLQICPFTKSPRMSGQGLADVGVPVGSIAYHTSSANSVVELMADTWAAITAMIEAGPEGRSGVSSILLAAPSFDDDFDLWSGPIFAMLEAGVIAAGVASWIGVVCFHPHYATPDGSTFPGFGHMHSLPRLRQWASSNLDEVLTDEQVAAGGAWQRRTPHATINVLRADQLQAAEGRRDTPKLYAENIHKLLNVGINQLQEDLDRERDF